MSGYISGISPSLRDLVVPVVDIFADGTDFNDGSSTYIDLSATPGSENSVTIAFDGVYQNHDTFSISGVRVTFDAAIPTGTSKIEARYAQENRNYTTIADNAVTNAKMADDAIGVAELSASGTASSSTFLRGDNAWASAGANIKEMLAMVCDGRARTVGSGTYTPGNVTGAQTPNLTYADLNGSSIAYTPPSGTTSVIYDLNLMVRRIDSNCEILCKFFIDSDEVTDARRCLGGYVYLSGPDTLRWVVRIGDGTDTGSGRVASWGSAKTLKWQIRNAVATSEGKAHAVRNWDGGGESEQLSIPILTITALG
jgi:hypothetical protein